MTALEALKLARETGVKVYPLGLGWQYWYLDDVLWYRDADDCTGPVYDFLQEEILNPDGSPVEWEVVPEPGT